MLLNHSRLLSTRQVEVVALVAAGRTNKQIAEHLIISHDTVKNHLVQIIDKLGVRSRTGAAVKALRLGLIA
jgi:DNA-binding NarL/FixJ family response regulator